MRARLRNLANGLWRGLKNPGVGLWLIFLYCALHFVVRLALSPVFSLDESEQVLFGESLQWGYRFREPPLMTWLAYATFSVVGLSHAALYALKYVLMAAGLAAYFASARRILGEARLATLATFGLLTTFVMGFLPHQDLMHTVLLASLLAAFLWALLRVLDSRKLADYLLLGLVVGLGLLSKYVFAVVVAGFGVGVLVTPALRQKLRWQGVLLAALLAVALVAPYVYWSMANEHSLFALAKDVTKGAGPALDPLSWLKGLSSFTLALASFLMPFIVLFAACFWNSLRPIPASIGSAEQRAHLRMFEFAFAASVFLMFIAVFFVGTESFKPRWLHQVALWLPLYLFLRVAIVGTSELRQQIFALGALVFAIAVVIARFVIYETNIEHCRQCREYMPYDRFAAGLSQVGFYQGTIVAHRHDMGGNLRYYLPQSRVVTPGYALSVFGPPTSEHGQCLVVWKGEGEMPAKLADYLREVLHATPGPDSLRGHVAARYIKLPADKRRAFVRLSYVLMPSGSGECR